jgi:hypothetical protein
VNIQKKQTMLSAITNKVRIVLPSVAGVGLANLLQNSRVNMIENDQICHVEKSPYSKKLLFYY